MHVEYLTGKMTARQAAEKFAAESWEEPRKVGQIIALPVGLDFRLVNGSNWYRCKPTANGWNIQSIEIRWPQ